MKITKNERKGNTVALEVQADYSEFKAAYDRTVQDATKSVRLPGFRKGKAPKNLIEKSLNPSALIDQAAQDLISSLYPQIIKKAQIDPVDYPKIEIKKLEENMPLDFTLEVIVYPEVTLGKYKGLKAEKKSTVVTDNEVDHVLGDLQNRFAKPIEVKDRGIAQNDIVELEIAAQSAGVEIKRWPRKISAYPMGAGYISPDFDFNLQGLTVDENKGFSISLPADYGVKELAGKTVDFTIKVLKITGKELMPLDDAFASTVSRYGTFAELKEEMKKNLEAEKKAESEGSLKNQLLDEAAKTMEADIPEAMVIQETEVILEELKTSLARSNLTLEGYMNALKKTEEDLRGEFRQSALTRVKGKVVLKAIAQAEKLDPTEEETDHEIKHMAQDAGKEFDEFKKSLRDSATDYIKDYLARRKALDFLVEHAKITITEKKEEGK